MARKAKAAETPAAESKPQQKAVVVTTSTERKTTLMDGSEKIIVHRYKGQYSSLFGPATLVRALDDMVDALSRSDFMKPWLKEQIAEAIRSGHEFVYRDSLDGANIRNVYRLCTDDDVRQLGAEGQLSAAMCRPGEIDERNGGKKKQSGPKQSRAAYHIPLPGPDEAKQYAVLQKQGKLILDIMREHVGADGGNIDGTELRMLLEAKRDVLNTKQDVMKLFGFHMSQFFKKSKPTQLVEYLEASGGDGDDKEVPIQGEDDDD
jgi:hypothetical protein